ncbi:SDR family oxidoreductase, partial [Streptomyces sp. NPDC127079]|uniref:SDR family oxidoreductase n=1 Tax=Streptomyces sp. NPDC127079 TaxID=3347132 RepID=UPI00366199F9
FAPFTENTPQEYRRVTEVTYLGFVNGTRTALGRMLPRNRGTIVQVGSALGERAIPLQSAYCAAKHAINGFTSSVRVELLHQGSDVHITVAQMPAVNTPQFSWVRTRLPRHAQPVPPIYQPEVAARGVLYAADHPERKQRYIGATTAATVWANRLAPALLDRYLARTGFDSQQTGAPAPGRARNLDPPAPPPPGPPPAPARGPRPPRAARGPLALLAGGLRALPRPAAPAVAARGGPGAVRRLAAGA